MIRLVLGGDKSGKSDAGLELLQAAAGEKLFVATGKPGDLQFRAQILDHRATRSADIPVVEADADLASVLRAAHARGCSVLVDSLDFWLFLALQDAAPGTVPKAYPDTAPLNGAQDAGPPPKSRVDDFLQCLTMYVGEVGPELIIVSSEIGLGPLAATAQTRDFVRRLGALHTQVARMSDAAYLVIAGMRLQLKG